jgi:hypothetical protein
MPDATNRSTSVASATRYGSIRFDRSVQVAKAQ